MDINRLWGWVFALFPATLLLFIFLFFDWQQVCAKSGETEICAGRSGWHGWGVLVGILVIAMLVVEGGQIARDRFKVKMPAQFDRLPHAFLAVVLAGAILLFTIIKFAVDDEFRHWPAWLGLILAIMIGAGGFLRLSGGGGMGKLRRRSR